MPWPAIGPQNERTCSNDAMAYFRRGVATFVMGPLTNIVVIGIARHMPLISFA